MSPELALSVGVGVVLPLAGFVVRLWADVREHRRRVADLERGAECREERLLALLREAVEAMRDAARD